MLAARVSGTAADETVQPIPGLPPISVGVGVQTSIYDCDKKCTYSPSTVSAGESSVQGIALDSIRLYINQRQRDRYAQIDFQHCTQAAAGVPATTRSK